MIFKIAEIFLVFISMNLFLNYNALGRKLIQSKLISSQIFGNNSDFMYYFIEIYIGTPPQRQTVILDTGSERLGFNCIPTCISCSKHINKQFNISGLLIKHLILQFIKIAKALPLLHN